MQKTTLWKNKPVISLYEPLSIWSFYRKKGYTFKLKFNFIIHKSNPQRKIRQSRHENQIRRVGFVEQETNVSSDV